MESIERRLDAVLGEFDSSSGPGFVAAVARRGFPDYRRAGGLSSIESGARNTEHTRMRIGSTTKQFTCLGVLLLAEDGLLSIDDDIRTHLTELPEYPSPVRIRNLMSNSGGLRCYLDLIGILAGFDRAISGRRAQGLELGQQSVNFSAGERLIYCNGGYLLLSMLIERLAKMPLGEFFAKRIFEPLGMTDTSFEPDDSKLIADAATLHQRHSDGSYYRGTIGITLSGDGAIVSTVEDLLRWLRHMGSPILGSAQTWKTMLHAGSDTEHGYGFGLMHNAHRGVKIIEHGGTVFGGRCQSLKVPDHGIDIAIMSNASDVFPSQIAERILDVLLEGHLGDAPGTASAQHGAGFAGTFYSAESGDAIRVLAKNDAVFLSGESGEIPLYESENGGLRTRFASLSTELLGRKTGSASVFGEIELREGGHRAVLQRIEPGPEGPPIQPHCGAYFSADCEAEATIEDGASPRLELRSPYGHNQFRLEPITENAWFAHLEDSWYALRLLVEFHTVENHDSLAITTGRTKRLQFERLGPKY